MKMRLPVLSSESNKLRHYQEFLRIAGFFLNSAVLACCLMLLIQSRASVLNRAHLLNLSAFASTLLALNGAVYLGWGWLGRKKIQAEERSISDPLTGALSRGAVEQILNDELRRAARYHYPLSLCVLDLDDFGSFNTYFGEEKADELLKGFSNILKAGIRFSDSVGRLENDEFLVVLPHTDPVRAQKFLSRILIQAEEKLDAGFSAGITVYHPGETQAQFVGRADLAVRQAKRDGKKKMRALIAGQDAQAVLTF